MQKYLNVLIAIFEIIHIRSVVRMKWEILKQIESNEVIRTPDALE